MARGFAAAVAKGHRPVEPHREAVACAEAMELVADGHLDNPFEHENLLIDMGLAKAAVIGDARA